MNYKADQLTHVPCNLCGADDTREIARKGPFAYVRCVQCGLIYVTPRPKDLRGRRQRLHDAGSDGKGNNADVSRMRTPGQIELLRREARRYIKYRRMNRLLDFGCSAGSFLAAARNEGWEATGVNISESRARAGREKKGPDIRPGTLREASFPDDYFDVIRINNVLEQLPDPLSELKEVWRILRPNGLLSLATINGRNTSTLLSGPDLNHYISPYLVYLFTPETLKRMLRRAGFRRVNIDTVGIKRGRYREGQIQWRSARKFLALFAIVLGRGHRIRATAKKIPLPYPPGESG